MDEDQNPDSLVTFDWTTYESPSTAVVSVVAEEAGVDSITIEPSYEVVDPDAVDNLLASTSAPHGAPNASIEFVYQDYRVLVKANGRGYLYDHDDGRQSTGEPRQVEAPEQAD